MAPLQDPIKHIVVVMMENRSFDHMLGFFKPLQGTINGLSGAETNPDSSGEPVKVSQAAGWRSDLDQDPAHEYLDVNEQIYSVRTDNVAGLQPVMQGFVKNFARYSANGSHIMHCFNPQNIPVLTTLATNFAVCDNWFSSVPGPTLPNRAFAHGATSQGRVDMSPIYVGLKTIYQFLNNQNVSSKIYYYSSHSWSMTLSFGHLMGNQFKYFGFYEDFKNDCATGRLPAYSFLEPNFQDYVDGGTVFANDQHPDNDVRMGEYFLRDVYGAIRTNQKLWNETLLIVVYDEHGGIYDHVPPPAAVSPDGLSSQNPGFDFTRLGVRVPAILVSPWVDSGVDHTQYEHASLVSTAISLLLGVDHTAPGNFLTQRDRAANPVVVKRNTPRTDVVRIPKLDVFNGTPLPDPNEGLNRPLSEYQKALVQSALHVRDQLGVSPLADAPPKTHSEAADFFHDTHKSMQAGAGK